MIDRWLRSWVIVVMVVMVVVIVMVVVFNGIVRPVLPPIAEVRLLASQDVSTCADHILGE